MSLPALVGILVLLATALFLFLWRESVWKLLKRLPSDPTIFSPERLTAIATTAAAIAAVAAVWAAVRQERATFDSNLYSKQIEIASEVSTTMELMNKRLGDLVSDVIANNSSFQTEPEKVLELSKNLADEIESLSANRTTAAAHFVLSEDYYKSFLDTYTRMRGLSRDIHAFLDFIHEKNIKITDDENSKFKKRFNEEWNHIYVDMRTFINCAAHQLRTGHYLTTLNECPSNLQ